MDLNGAVVVVTGGRGGLGTTICRVFQEAGSRVMAVDISAIDAPSALSDVIQVTADVSTSAGAAVLTEAAVAAFGRIDVLVNNAAINRLVDYRDLDALTEALWSQMLTVNLTGPFLCSKAVAKVMQAQGQGRIISVASTSGLRPSGSSIAYAVSKAGVIHLTRCLARALAPEILVSAVAPGMMEETGMGERLGPAFRARFKQNAPLGRSVVIADVADVILTLARSDSITGTVVTVDAGSTMA